jgi:hypothetical protein
MVGEGIQQDNYSTSLLFAHFTHLREIKGTWDQNPTKDAQEQ